MRNLQRSSIVGSFAAGVIACSAPGSGSAPAPETGPGPGVEAGSLRLGPDELYYECRGSGRPVVFVNGGSMDLRQWDGQVEAFEEDRRVVRFDHRGWGRSSPITEPFSPVDDLAALIDELGLEDVVLVGSSFGGGVALDYTLEAPDRVGALVLLAPAVSGHPWSAAFIERAERMAAARAEGGVDGHVAAILGDPHFIPCASEDAELAARAEELLRANFRLYSNDFTLFRQTEPLAQGRLEDVRPPTLLVLPGRDLPELVDLIAELDERIPDSRRVEIAGAGHMVHMERPAEVNAAILAFLSELP